jgi:hypothetical protein
MFEVVYEIIFPSKFIVKKTAEQIFSMYKHFTKGTISEFPKGEDFTCAESDGIKPLFRNIKPSRPKLPEKEKKKDEDKRTHLEIIDDYITLDRVTELVSKNREKENESVKKSMSILNNLEMSKLGNNISKIVKYNDGTNLIVRSIKQNVAPPSEIIEHDHNQSHDDGKQHYWLEDICD